MANLTNRPSGNQRTSVLNGRGIAIAKIDHIDDLGGLRRLGHFMRIIRIRRQRLFAQNVLTCGDRGQ